MTTGNKFNRGGDGIDQDVLREAVKLADGWEWREHGHNCDDILYRFYDGWQVFTAALLPENPVLLDALAAQLRRQVNAMNSCEILVYDGWVEINTRRDRVNWNRLIIFDGPNESENTINAIVQSEVLKK